jgi:hypothetical protein
MVVRRVSWSKLHTDGPQFGFVRELSSDLALSAEETRNIDIFVCKERIANIVLRILASTANKLVIRATRAQKVFIFDGARTTLPENLSMCLKVEIGLAPR